MDARRRHQLKDNTLASGLEGLPGFYRRYGNQILIVVIFLLLAFIFIRSRLGSARDREAQSRFSLSNARSMFTQLAQMPIERMRPEGVAAMRQTISLQAEQAVDDVLSHSKDPAIRANALLARGDLNWRLANFPELPGADTQPALKYGKTPEDLLAAAEHAYQQVVSAQPASPPAAVCSAWFGLAKIAENRRQWDVAQQYYQNILTEPSTPEAVAGEATAALKMLQKIQQPIYTGNPTTSIIMGPSFSLPEATAPASTRSAATAAEDLAETRPATRSAPSTEPAGTTVPDFRF
jgi:hypothetical protein